jgi:hypothetical protein
MLMDGNLEHFDTPMPVTKGFLNGLKRYGSKSHFVCPKCGGRAVRALSDTRGWEDEGEFYCLHHKEPFTAPLSEKQ